MSAENRVQRLSNPRCNQSTTPGATPRQRPSNGGATYTPIPPCVAPALGGRVHALGSEWFDYLEPHKSKHGESL